MTEPASVSPTNTRTTAAVVVIVAFIGGLFVGIAGDHFYLFHRGSRMKQFASRRIVEHLDRELHLTAQQKAAVQRIVDQHHVKIDSILSRLRPQIRAELDAANAEIDKLLTPEQREQFKKIRMRVPPGGHRGPPPF